MNKFASLLAVILVSIFSPNVRAESGRLRQILEGARHHGPGYGFERVGRGLESMERVLESAPVAGTEIKTSRFSLRTVDMSDFDAVKKVWGKGVATEVASKLVQTAISLPRGVPKGSGQGRHEGNRPFH